MTDQTVWPQVEFDRPPFPVGWYLAPGQWPWGSYRTPEQWAAAVAGGLGEPYGWDKNARAAFATRLVAVDAQQDPEETRVWTVVDHEEPAPSAYWVTIFAGPHFPDAPELTDLVVTEGERLIVPPEVTPFESERLGTGLRSVRYSEAPPELMPHLPDSATPVVMLVNYAFRTPRSDVLLMASSDDVPLLEEMLEELDDIARAIHLTY